MFQLPIVTFMYADVVCICKLACVPNWQILLHMVVLGLPSLMYSVVWLSTFVINERAVGQWC
jgi:hypothetical protein